MDTTQQPETRAHLSPPRIVDTFPNSTIELIESDGEPLESDWHVNEIFLLLDTIRYHLRDRSDYYCAGNMFVYFNAEQSRNRDYRGPDFFLVSGGVSHTPQRPYWAVWKENNRYPDLIVELTSPSTRKMDLTTKKDIYEKTFRTSDYFCYDPDRDELLGWHLNDKGKYRPLKPNPQGRLWCQSMGLWVGTWEGVYLGYSRVWVRFFDAQGNLIPTHNEAARQSADVERQRADAEKQRADTLAAEVARLKRQLGK